VHVGLGDVLDDHRDVIVPPSDGLVIGCRDEPPVVVHKGDGVYRAQVLIIRLHNLMRTSVVLTRSATGSRDTITHLDDLLILHTRQPDVLLVRIGVELDHVGDLAVGESLDTFASFGVPHLEVSIIRRGYELFALVVERNVFDGLRMTEEGTQAVALVIDVPELPCERRPNTTRVVLTLTLVSMLADNKRWPLRGNNRIADTALLCPVQV
jgi:hypothetical protein